MSGAAPLRAGAATPRSPSARGAGCPPPRPPPAPGLPARRPEVLTAASTADPAAGGGEEQQGGGAGGSAGRAGRVQDDVAGGGQGPRCWSRGGEDGVKRARSRLHTARCPAPRPCRAAAARRARAWLLLPRRAPRLSLYSLLPAPIPALRVRARPLASHSPARCDQSPPSRPVAGPSPLAPPLPGPPMPLARSRLTGSEGQGGQGLTSRAPG